MKKNRLIIAVAGLLVLGSAGLFYFNNHHGVIFHSAITPLESVKVYKIVKVHGLQDIRQALEEARSKGLKIAIAGARHAQGGQQSYPNGIVLDMMAFNKVISLDQEHKVIRVQSGTTWKQVQDYIRPYGYAGRVTQTANIFTVGGSLSSNIHGKDPQYGSFIETVQSFHLMKADGNIINVSRQENPELFSLVIGGYGLFGIITDADILLADNEVYKEDTIFINYKEFPEYFRSNILGNPRICWLEAYFEESKQEYLRTLKVTTYSRVVDDGKAKYTSRAGLQDKTFQYSRHDQIIMQEYFVPINQFVPFVDGLRGIFRSFRKVFRSGHDVYARPWVIRYAKQDKQSFLPYAKADSFSIELLINTASVLPAQRFKDIQDWTRQIVDLSLSCAGTFYLTKIAVWPDKGQLLKAYPEFNEFIKKKEEYDPQGIFMNQFYEHYR